MGTPQFAVPALNHLIESSHNVIAVYTMPPRPSGRGNQLVKSPIQIIAEQHNLQIFTPKNFKDDVDYNIFNKLNADLAVVAAYGVILPERILKASKYGCINIHPSSLPRWRGAAPIQHTILSGDSTTSVCVIKMDKGMDTGDILLQQPLKISDNMTSSMLHDITSKIGAEMIIKVISQITDGTINPQKQSEINATHARKIDRNDEKLNFDQSSYLINSQVRAFSPKPGAYFTYHGENIKILEATYDDSVIHNSPPATVLDDNLTIACKEGILKPQLLQREGRKAIYLEAFLRGFKIPKNTLLSY